jgi:hypothetical protein
MHSPTRPVPSPDVIHIYAKPFWTGHGYAMTMCGYEHSDQGNTECPEMATCPECLRIYAAVEDIASRIKSM